MKKIFLLTILSLLFFTSNAQLAFPGAEGFGKNTTGGRNGSVYHVTNLNDSGAGSFRDAVSQSNRIVVFDVGGIITLKSTCVVKKNITIAGQTAPGDGITITGQRLAFNSDSGNDIVRYIRVRLPRAAGSNVDAMSISDNADNLIFDHISVSWGADGTFDINSSDASNITIQDCIIGQGADWHGHSTGGLIQCGPISIIRSLFIDNVTRNPKIRFEHEIINCVIYNWAENGLIMGDTDNADSHCNLIGNYFISGPSTTSLSNYVSRPTSRYYVYEDDNWLDTNNDGSLNGSLLDASNGAYKTATVVSTPYSHPGVNTTLSAQEAVAHIIANVGPSISRDAVDELLINQLSSYGTLGAIVQDETSNGIPNGGLGYVFNGPKPVDTDNDGMPDDWEDTNGTNKNSNDAMTKAANGYANIENYINSIDGPVMNYLKHPTNVYSTSKTDTSITLKWTNNDVADQIFIEYGTSSSNLTESLTVTGDLTTTIIPNLTPSTTYYFSLKVKNTSAESAFTEVTSVKTMDAPMAPVACSSPNPSNGSTLTFIEGVNLTWDNITNNLAGELKYDVYFGTASDQLILVASDLTQKSYSAGDLEDSKTYYWRVKTTNDLGSDDGVVWSFTTNNGALNKVLYIPFDETSGSIAENLEGSNDAIAKNGFVTNWYTGGYKNNCMIFNASPTNECMSVDYYTDLAMGTSSFTISLWFKSPTNNSMSDAYLFHKGTHSASNGGTGKWIGIQYVKGSRLTFAIDDNSTKTSLDITNNPDQYFSSQWHHLVCIRDVASDKLRIYIDAVKVAESTDNTGNISEIAELVLGNCNVNFNTPFYGYMDEVIIYKNALTSSEVTALHNQATSINKSTQQSEELIVYPNPFNESIHIDIDLESNKNYSLHIYDLSGKLVRSEFIYSNDSQIQINNLDDLSTGLYTIKVFNDSDVYYSKAIKK